MLYNDTSDRNTEYENLHELPEHSECGLTSFMSPTMLPIHCSVVAGKCSELFFPGIIWDEGPRDGNCGERDLHGCANWKKLKQVRSQRNRPSTSLVRIEAADKACVRRMGSLTMTRSCSELA